MLIFDKRKHYEKLIEQGFEKYPNKRDLIVLCENWLAEGEIVENLYDRIIAFCKKWNSQFRPAKNEQLILSVLDQINNSTEYKFSLNTNMKFYKTEIEEIKSITDKKLQKIMFIIMCLAKWRNANYIYLNCESSIKLKDIFDLARIKDTKINQMEMLHQLNSSGRIDTQLKPILKVFIPSICEDGECMFEFSINDNMIQEWLNLVGVKCLRCGNGFEKNCNKQKYCKNCAKIIKNEQNKSYLNR